MSVRADITEGKQCDDVSTGSGRHPGRIERDKEHAESVENGAMSSRTRTQETVNQNPTVSRKAAGSRVKRQTEILIRYGI